MKILQKKHIKLVLVLLTVFMCLTIISAAETISPAEEQPMGSLTQGSFTIQIPGFNAITINLLTGFRLNGIIFFVTLVLSLPLGMVVAFGLLSKFAPLRWLCKTIVWVVRGTPLLLQLYIVFFVPGLIFGTPMRDRMLAALIAFVINYTMYFAEIYRGALENMPKGQFEAGKVLGLSKWQVFFHIILFQVIKNITAPIGNEVMTLVKDTSLARVIAVHEILMRAESYANMGIIWPLFYSGAFFLIATAIVTLVFGYFERRLKRATGQ